MPLQPRVPWANPIVESKQIKRFGNEKSPAVSLQSRYHLHFIEKEMWAQTSYLCALINTVRR